MAQTIMTPDELKALTVNEVLEKFSASAGGLSEAGAKERLAEYGYNEIKEKKINPILKFLSYFWGPIPLMIEAAAAPTQIFLDATGKGHIQSAPNRLHLPLSRRAL